MSRECQKPYFVMLIISLSFGESVFSAENITETAGVLLTAQQLVAEVLQANPQLEIAKATWNAAKARVIQRQSFDDPLFSYTVAPLTMGDSRSQYGRRLEVSQKMPWPGKLYLQGEVASYQADAKNQTIQGLRLKLSIAAKKHFVDWYYIHQAMAINQQNQAILKTVQEIAVSRYSTGLANKQEALQAEMAFVRLEHQAIVLRREQRAIRTHINTLLNQPTARMLAKPDNLGVINTLPEIKNYQEYAFKMHPYLKVLAATAHVAKSQSALAKKNRYPDMTFKAGYNTLWNDSNKHFTIGVGVNVPIFQDKHSAAESEAVAQIKKVEWQRVDFIAKLKEEIQIYYDQTVENIHVFKLYKKKLLPLAKETLNAAKSEYQSGQSDFLSVLESEKSYIQTLLQMEKALAETHKSLANLEGAAGLFEPLLVVQKSEEK